MREIKFRAALHISGVEEPLMLNDVIVYNSAHQIGLSLNDFTKAISQLGDKYYIDFDDGTVVYADEDTGFEVAIDFEQGDEWIYLYYESVDIMQYTGLKDKNGVEIYGGDIVEFINAHGLDDDYGQIMFEDYSWKIFNDESCLDELLYNITYPSVITVIGNIYENPELLEQL